MRCSHVLVWVDDLHRAVRDYRHLGFQVDYASEQSKARHAHVWFPQGPILELLTTPGNARHFTWLIDLVAGRGAGRRMVGWAGAGEGFCDMAVLGETADLASVLEDLRRDGVTTGRPVRWVRRRPDGQRTRFQFAYPTRPGLPFLVSPYDPPQHPARSAHPNGARGMTRVRLGVASGDETAVARLVGDDPAVTLEPATTTGVRAIELAGLQHELEPTFLHGAVIRRDSKRTDTTAGLSDHFS
ncbi:VOC family protein [Phaeospirillum tilakii]|uniref:VOC family protein n=1 Tax=Phaeospirillum tilakii TaxID=741673 RepID=A0ABW5CGH2_9PROT